MKQTTVLTIINDKQGRNVFAFIEACKVLGIDCRPVSSTSQGLMDMSIHYNCLADLFILGQNFQLIKSK